jgi:hypothetical protein
MAVLAAASCLLAALAGRRLPLGRGLATGTAAVAVALVLVSPLLVAAATALAGGDLEADERENGARFYSTDLAGLLVGNPENPVLGNLVAPLAARMGSRADGANDLGVTLAALALVGLVAWRRTLRARWLALLAVAALAVSLGPVLWVAGTQYVPLAMEGRGEGPVSALLPFTWLQRTPGLSGLRAPGRFALLAALPVALLAGSGVQRLSTTRLRAWAVGALAVPLVLVEAASPIVNRLDAALPQVYEPIAADPDPDVIVVDVPLGFSRGVLPVGRWSDRAALAASVHGRRTAAGFASRLGDQPIERLLGIALYRDLLALQEVPPGQPSPPTSPTQAAADAARYGLDYVVLSDETPGAAAVRDYLGRACYERAEAAEGLERWEFRGAACAGAGG